MDILIKDFNGLNNTELYEILRLRSEIFVVEQDCVYQDIDGIDTRAIHIFAMEDSVCKACLRVFRRDDSTIQIGRVVVSVEYRRKGLGHQLMEHAIRVAKETFGTGTLYLEAQCYAIEFYRKSGFSVCSDEFLEDGIPHVQMTRPL